MTTADVRPSVVEPGPPTPMPPAPPGPGRSPLVRRLPYAVAVLTLAVGYLVGHGTSSPSTGSTAPTTALVTPEQINQALATTNGQPVVNDRGFSKLENGVQHSHGFELPMSQADRKELARELNLARQTALKYPTLADAQRAGMFRAGPFAPGLGTHMIMPADFGYSAGPGRMTDAQIEHPMAWIYDGTKPTSPVAGLFYTSNVPNPAGFVGPNDVWHKHSNICIKMRPGGGFDAPLGADNDATVAQCNAVGGQLIPQTGPLLHAWVVPGYEDSLGVFAHLSPAITCNDGTYYTIDVTKPGDRTSACLDGTE